MLYELNVNNIIKFKDHSALIIARHQQALFWIVIHDLADSYSVGFTPGY